VNANVRKATQMLAPLALANVPEAAPLSWIAPATRTTPPEPTLTAASATAATCGQVRSAISATSDSVRATTVECVPWAMTSTPTTRAANRSAQVPSTAMAVRHRYRATRLTAASASVTAPGVALIAVSVKQSSTSRQAAHGVPMDSRSTHTATNRAASRQTAAGRRHTSQEMTTQAASVSAQILGRGQSATSALGATILPATAVPASLDSPVTLIV
jgi:hypothetical protein